MPRNIRVILFRAYMQRACVSDVESRERRKHAAGKTARVSAIKIPRARARFARRRYIDSCTRERRGGAPMGTRVIQYNRIMRAAIRGRKSGRVRGESTQCFASVRGGLYVLDYKLHRPQAASISRPRRHISLPILRGDHRRVRTYTRIYLLLTVWNFNERSSYRQRSSSVGRNVKIDRASR